MKEMGLNPTEDELNDFINEKGKGITIKIIFIILKQIIY